jgi:hypothetical protein
MSTETQSPEQDRIAQLEAELAQAKGRQAGAPQDDSDRPWNVAREHVQDEHTRAEAPVPYRGPGAVLHHFPILTGGSGGNLNGPYVRALAELLAEAGYSTNNVIKGLVSHFDDSVQADVSRFKADHDAGEPTDAYQGHTRPAPEIAQNLVGPYTVQKLFEVAAEKIGQPVEQLIARVEYDVARQLR